MGVITKGILGGFKGKVGTVVGANWKGIDTVRSMPSSVANPRTSGQMLNRGKFKMISMLASTLLGNLVRPFWNGKNAKMSGYNSFIRANVELGTTENTLVYPELKMATGSLEGVTLIDATASNGSTEVSVEYDPNTGIGNAASDDFVNAVVINATTGAISTSIKDAARPDSLITVTVPEVSTGDLLKVYVFASKATDDKVVSNSVFLARTVTA